MQVLRGRQLSCNGTLRSLQSLQSTLLQNARPRSVPLSNYTATSRRAYALHLNSIDAKWRAKWADSKESQVDNTRNDERPKYILPMFPYPSGSLHLGHLRAYTLTDVISRFHQLQGDRVIMPMGWDAFGLPAENAALQNGVAPDEWTRKNIAKMKEQLGLMNANWSWERVSDGRFRTLNKANVSEGALNLRSRLLQAHPEAVPYAL